MASVKRPDDAITIRFLSSVLSSLNHKVVQQAPLWSLSWRAPTPSRDDSDPELQFFNHLATMFDTGSYGGLAIAVTGKYDEEGPMVTIVVSRNSSRSDMKPEPNHCQPDALQRPGSESVGFSVLTLPPTSITVAKVHEEIA